ncbi:Mu transposase domain-containing protein, partial [Streptomyces wuyuanensis]|uniref:Mu transposase domain-containing protein n=1 Tax=Streptomyces wuyuanensis TaxID=1196353 RepID=UPI003F4CEA52
MSSPHTQPSSRRVAGSSTSTPSSARSSPRSTCLRPVGKDCLVAFGSNLYSVPARRVRPRQLVEIRATKSQVMRIPPSRTPTDRRCWPPICGRSAAGPVSSRRPTGTV